MRGLEYLNAECLAAWWTDLDELVRGEIRTSGLGAQEFLHELNPLWRTVGRVTFHLAESKRDPEQLLPSWRPIQPFTTRDYAASTA